MEGGSLSIEIEATDRLESLFAPARFLARCFRRLGSIEMLSTSLGAIGELVDEPASFVEPSRGADYGLEALLAHGVDEARVAWGDQRGER